MRGKTCENVTTHRLIQCVCMSVCAVQAALNESRTGPFVETPAMRRQGEGGKRLKVEVWVLVENVSLKLRNISFSAVSPSDLYFTMAHSVAGDALAYSDGASLEGVRRHRLDNETQHVDKPQQTGQSEDNTCTTCGTCTVTVTWPEGSSDPSYQGLQSLLLLMSGTSCTTEQITLDTTI